VSPHSTRRRLPGGWPRASPRGRAAGHSEEASWRLLRLWHDAVLALGRMTRWSVRGITHPLMGRWSRRGKTRHDAAPASCRRAVQQAAVACALHRL